MNSWWISYFARIVFAAILGVAGLWIAMRHCDKVGVKSFCAYYLLRLLSMFVLCVMLGHVPSDVVGWHMHANWMMDGLFPGKGFLTPYYLGMNGLLWLAVKCWNNPYSIIFMYTCIEAICVVLIFRIFRLYAGEQKARMVCILYLTSPIVTMTSWFGAQDEPVILLAVICVFGLLVSKQSSLMLFLAAFTCIFFTKILTVFFLQPLYFSRKYRIVFLCALGFVLYIAVAIWIGVNPFNMCFGRELGMKAVGDDIVNMQTIGNIWFVLPSVPNVVQTIIFLSTLGLSASVPLYYIYIKGESDGAELDVCILIMILFSLVFMMFYRMSFATYLIAVLPFVWYIVLMDGYINKIFVLVWSWIAAVKDPLYFVRFHNQFNPEMWDLVLSAFTLMFLISTGVLLVAMAMIIIQKKIMQDDSNDKLRYNHME